MQLPLYAEFCSELYDGGKQKTQGHSRIAAVSLLLSSISGTKNSFISLFQLVFPSAFVNLACFHFEIEHNMTIFVGTASFNGSRSAQMVKNSAIQVCSHWKVYSTCGPWEINGGAYNPYCSRYEIYSRTHKMIRKCSSRSLEHLYPEVLHPRAKWAKGERKSLSVSSSFWLRLFALEKPQKPGPCFPQCLLQSSLLT